VKESFPSTTRLSWLQQGILALALKMGGSVRRRDVYMLLYGFPRTRDCLRYYFSPGDVGPKYKAATVAVSNSVKRLEARGLVIRKAFAGVHLTPAGRTVAQALGSATVSKCACTHACARVRYEPTP